MAGATRRVEQWFLAVALSTVACASGVWRAVPVSSAALEPAPAGVADLDVVVETSGVHEPVEVRGSSVGFVELGPALQRALASVLSPGAEVGRHPTSGARLTLELTAASAEASRGRLVVHLTVRSTLRARAGDAYLAQGQQVCSSAAVVDPADGAPVVAECMARLARDVASWLQRVRPLSSSDTSSSPR